MVERTVVLEVGDHPWISEPSTAVYDEVSFESAKGIALAIQVNVFIPDQPVSTEVLDRLLKGINISDSPADKIKNYFN